MLCYKRQNYHKSNLIITTKWPKWSLVHSPSNGASGGLVVLWNPLLIQGHIIFQHSNFQVLKMENFDASFTLINVYGPNSSQDKLKIWDKLSHLIQMQNSHQVILGGDFNTILNQEEKVCGIYPPLKTI